MRVLLQPAFILHARPYRETSLLLDVLTEQQGRISLIARGVRGNKKSIRALLQPFIPLLISWQGKTELMTLTHCEMEGRGYALEKEGLLAGFYLNELLMYLLLKHDIHPKLYELYRNTLINLRKLPLNEASLRIFEKRLLEELGYGIELQGEIETREPFLEEVFYRYYPELGFKRCEEVVVADHQSMMIFSGKSILALALEKLDDPVALKEVKRLMRVVFKPLLAGKELKSRELFGTINE